METPSSTRRRLTRSSAQKSANPKHDRPILFDITNDSPIVGLATTKASKTPSSTPAKTPGSGEALLRGQVKTLLQKVEEESEFVKPLTSVVPYQLLLGHLRSPRGLLAPTPANTPEVGKEDLLLGIQEALSAAVVTLQEENLGECLINRELLFDSPEKSDTSAASSSLTYQDSTSSLPEKFSEDDCSSVWSVQVNPGSEADDTDTVDYDDLCEGFDKLKVAEAEEEKCNKHVRFVYNSEDELEGEEEVGREAGSLGKLVLKGVPVSEGKHLRFPADEE